MTFYPLCFLDIMLHLYIVIFSEAPFTHYSCISSAFANALHINNRSQCVPYALFTSIRGYHISLSMLFLSEALRSGQISGHEAYPCTHTHTKQRAITSTAVSLINGVTHTRAQAHTHTGQ